MHRERRITLYRAIILIRNNTRHIIPVRNQAVIRTLKAVQDLPVLMTVASFLKGTPKEVPNRFLEEKNRPNVEANPYASRLRKREMGVRACGGFGKRTDSVGLLPGLRGPNSSRLTRSNIHDKKVKGMVGGKKETV